MSSFFGYGSNIQLDHKSLEPRFGNVDEELEYDNDETFSIKTCYKLLTSNSNPETMKKNYFWI